MGIDHGNGPVLLAGHFGVESIRSGPASCKSCAHNEPKHPQRERERPVSGCRAKYDENTHTHTHTHTQMISYDECGVDVITIRHEK